MSRRTNIDHSQVAARLRANRGQWLPVGEYRNASSARSLAYVIRTGTNRHVRAYLPTGAFEARTRLTDDGTLVEARFMGVADMRHVKASFDTERVLGQIERGEVRCGADAAREIAARHQAAYGDAVWGGQDEDAAWADALASLDGSAA